VDVAGAEETRRVGEKVARALAAPLSLDEQSLQPAASIGTATYPDDAAGVEALLKCADSSMYDIKTAQRG
jgi:predicted signal transduction protein with EAL and GGDEF domain